jgi:hypothetical protein
MYHGKAQNVPQHGTKVAQKCATFRLKNDKRIEKNKNKNKKNNNKAIIRAGLAALTANNSYFTPLNKARFR